MTSTVMAVSWGIVFVGDVCVNNELVRNGLAWSGCTGIIARFRFVMTG
jgi:hypothetical protein